MATRLARIGPHGEPSPALDARILGAAHAATGTSRSANRWPALIGLAATLALAVGITWQLRPLDERAVESSVQETESAPASESAAGTITAPADMTRRQALPEAPSTAAPPPPSQEAGQRQSRETGGTPSPMAATDADPVPARSPPAPPPPPPATVAPSVATPSIVADQNAGQVMRATEERAAMRAERESLSRSAPPPAAPPAPPSPEAFPADAGRTADMAKSTSPMDTPVARDRELEPLEWIERIRLRRDTGDLAGARESLQLLRREHPQTRVPSDLIALTERQP